MTNSPTAKTISVCVFFLMLFVAIVESNADVPDWVLEALDEGPHDPDVVYYQNVVGLNCGIEYDEIQEIIEDELIRSRIKPLSWVNGPESSDGLLVLDVGTNCLKRDGLNAIFSIDVYFAFYFIEDSLNLGALLIDWDFGSFGVGGRDYILRSVEDSIEDAITAYVRANFDL